MQQQTKRGFSTREAATYLGRSPSWLRKKRLRGVLDPDEPGPTYVKTPSGAVLYLREQLDNWLDNLERAERES
jgi:anthranilate phosphoribosyltransferase